MAYQFQRRAFLHSTLVAGAAMMTRAPLRAAQATDGRPNAICAFMKFLQSMSYEELADAIAASGFDGIEATVRRGGYIAPERAPDELPKLNEVLAERGLKITILTTDVLGTDQPATEPLLRAAANLGISTYRLGFYQYDLSNPVLAQLDEIKPKLTDLAALNGELGVQGVYQNHSGAKYIGAAVWDFYSVAKDLPPEQLALAFDIRHATVEAGLAWPAVYNAVRSHIGAIFVKDFDWRGREARHVPLGQGRVDRKFFGMLKRDAYRGPISLHVEYLEDEDAKENLTALQQDFATLRGWLQA